MDVGKIFALMYVGMLFIIFAPLVTDIFPMLLISENAKDNGFYNLGMVGMIIFLVLVIYSILTEDSEDH